jgi:uncharacterized protein YwgA
VERQALPLLLASSEYIGDNETQPLDRVRMQKGVFLLEMKGPDAWRNAYQFVPYDWGPYSPDLSDDVRSLLRDGEMSTLHFDGFRYGEFRTTAAGLHLLAEVIEGPDELVAEFVREVREFVTTRTFSRLLRDVYSAFPDYATRSRFNQ